jgi:hypothetical protein
MKNKTDPLSEGAFSTAESKLSGIDGHNAGYGFDLHGAGSVKAPPAGAPLSPGREASVKKAAAASVAKRKLSSMGKMGAKLPTMGKLGKLPGMGL